MDQIRVFSPATVANVSCGFDIMGFALDSVGDTITVKKEKEPGIRIRKILGHEVPMETSRNVSGVASLALLKALQDTESGFGIEIDKGIKPGSGIGSSAASSAGAVWAVNELLDRPFTHRELIPFAMEGERLAGGEAIADNVSPALLGGFSLVRSYNPLDIIALPFPLELHVVILHPQIEIKTCEARQILSRTISLEQGIQQWGNVAGLVAGLYSGDYGLIGRSLVDHVVEPVRSGLIPHFFPLKEAAINAGALGSGISGSGPSVFALCEGEGPAGRVAAAMETVYHETSIPFNLYISRVSERGVRKMEEQ